jgi:rhodanese-related sulfurtransferase
MIRPRLSGLSPHARLAALALLLGAGALAVGDPARGGRVTIDAARLAALVEGEVDHVTPDTLASWILEGRQDYRLIDLRTAEEFDAYHVPTAERISIAELAAGALPRNEKIVLYSAEGIHSAQAWFLLEAQRYPAVYILLGGLAQWNEQVLYPEAPPQGAAPREGAAFARAAERARFFGGSPRAASAPGVDVAAALAPPPAARVAPPPAAPRAAAGAKKKKEGC